MPRNIRSRNIRYWVAFAAAAAGLAWAGWPAAASTVTTVVNRADVVVVTLLLAGLPVLARRVVGPRGASRAARILRAGGYATVFALVAVKAEVARSAGPRPAGGPAVAGVVAGEIVFLAVVAVYLGWVLAATSRRSLASPAALATGTAAGAAAGVLMFLLPPRGGLLHLHVSWQADLYRAGQMLAILLALATGIAAGVLTARRTGRRERAGNGGGGGRLPLAELRARQGLAAGLCAGMTAALVASVLHTGSVALLPHQVQPLHWTLNADQRQQPVTTKTVTENLYQLEPPNGLVDFEMSLADTAAGYLLVLVFFPLFGAGLGAWGALYTAGRPGQQPGNGGGGGGGGEPEPAAPPPDGGRRADEDHRPAILRGYLKDLPAGHGLPEPGGGRRAAERPSQIPAGLSGPPWPAWPDAGPGRSP
jgi:hypothetical protein